MFTLSIGDVLYVSLPDGTIIPFLYINGQYVPANLDPSALLVTTFTLEPVLAPTDDQPVQGAYVLMFLQRDGTYDLNP
ncbi:hypothetical protein C7212DRAFT_337926, partial [Tuber magnatum]